ncbi:LamB/YcsF family protein [Bradyrhizobium elkanii]|uniref:LamB/YcsF family protein n=1 Tax=Bradyrhizobium elkanii TaxID=29448 RepID=UPI0036F2ACF2
MMPHIDVANVACGFHASDFNHMRKTVQLAKQFGVKVGAHPSLPRSAGIWSPGDEDRPRGAGQLPALPDRRAQGLPGCRRHGTQSHQAARRTLRHGIA